MAKSLQDYTVGESVAPYIKVVVSTTADMDVCRAVMLSGAAAGSITLTIGGSDVAVYMLRGVVYPIACTKSSSANVLHLY
jgi:hypothetical protein|tara:strand:- start:660 stop:899 length:240 start_codon:yes stop_codon:yes gene_type:complete